MTVPPMPDKMLSVLRTEAGRRWFVGVYTPTGWRLRSRTTGRFVSVSRALGWAKGIGRLLVKTEAMRKQLDYLSEEFWAEYLTNKEFREEITDYLRASMGYPPEMFL